MKGCSVAGCDQPRRAREWCQSHYNAWYNHGDPLVVARPLNMGVCKAEGCDKRPRSRTSPWCEMHYGRLRRNGSLERGERFFQPAIEHDGGYILEYAPGHPIARPGYSHVYEHRRVFFDGNGWGPFECHVCKAEVTWATMHVDHLDDDPRNNAIGNLAPACPTCNRGRGRHKMVATQRRNGRQLSAFGQTKCITEWAGERAIPNTTLSRRLADGWTPERALSEPPGPTGRKARHTS
jgi:hypothetical protein